MVVEHCVEQNNELAATLCIGCYTAAVCTCSRAMAVSNVSQSVSFAALGGMPLLTAG